MDKVGLLATSRKQTARPAPVTEFYHSPLFSQSVAYAQRNYDRFYFYNADGLLLPDDLMFPHNDSIRAFSIQQKQDWAGSVVKSLLEYELPGSISLYLHGGIIYREFLEPALKEKGFTFQVPLKGYPIGKQLQWYKEQLEIKTK